MADVDKVEDSKSSPTRRGEDEISLNAGDNAILPEGQVDPVFEKKAKLLNRAVRPQPPLPSPLSAQQH